jgi:hypothetical protein
MNKRKSPQDLRSYRWFGLPDLRSFTHRSRAKQMGYGSDDYAGKPVIAVINTWSDPDHLPQPFPHARRRGQTRRLAGGRLPCRIARDAGQRDVYETFADDVPQSAGDGDRRVAALPAD